MTQRRYRGLPGWISIITIATFASLAEVVWAEEPAEVAKAKTGTWKPISIRFYRWQFGEKNHLGAEQIVQVAENILAAQNKDGGWSKNNDLSTLKKPKTSGKSTFDNLSTYTHIMYLVRVRHQTELKRYDESIRSGIQYTLGTQNRMSGGWHGADVDAITFNDDVMANIMTFLHEVSTDDGLYDWLDEAMRSKAKTAYNKSLACILACQVRQGAVLTAWGQQHDHRTLKPCWARNYEPPCITACESVGVIRFLMTIDDPSKEVVQSIQAATSVP